MAGPNDPVNFQDPNDIPPLSADEINAIIAGTSQGLLSDEHLQGPYQSGWIESYLAHDSGKRHMAVAGDPDLRPRSPSRVVKVHSGRTQRIIEFNIVRRTLFPLVPSPVPTNVNEVLLTAELRVREVMITETASNVEYQVKGRYVYALYDPEWYENGVQMPVVPWTTIALADAVLLVDQFQQGMF